MLLRVTKKPFILCSAVIAVCFLYTGSAYMSQFYRLMDFYDAQTVDLITSGWNYLLHAAGIGLFSLGMHCRPKLFGSMRLFALLLLEGAVWMVIFQFSSAGAAIAAAGYVFHLHVGVYFGFYLTMLSKNVPVRRAGLCYGIAYAAGSLGTHLLSLPGGGTFLVSKGITAVYVLLAAVTAALALLSEGLGAGGSEGTAERRDAHIGELITVVAVMTVISVLGSGLYYSLPQAEGVNWNVIRSFYAPGLIIAGLITDKSRRVGAICAAASLTYPLIVSALISEGVAGSVTMALGYVFRGFLSVYCVIAFTDVGAEDRRMLPLAPLGLLISRAVEAFLSLALMAFEVSALIQLIFSAVCFIPLLLLLFRMQSKKHSAPPVSDEKRLALFSERYGLTGREAEVLECMAAGLSDEEIAGKFFISKNTVRFHVSNILRKTASSNRVEAVRALKKS